MKNQLSIKSSPVVLLIVLCWIILQCSCKQVESRRVWLDDLDLNLIDQAAGGAVARKSMWNTPLVIACDTFQRGVGTHASGMIAVKLSGGSRRFHAMVGLDDSPPEHEKALASAEFIVYADGSEIWSSGIMRAGEKARLIDLDVSGVDTLQLYCDHAGDGIAGDRTNWADAWFEVSGDAPVTYRRSQEPEYRLTPTEGKMPVINAPYIFSARPGNPVLFAVPVSGERPITVRAGNLPSGLILDTVTGRISGIMETQGRFDVEVTVKNMYGKDVKNVQIISGEEISPTPPMGWNSWNVFGKEVTQEKVKAAAEAMVKSGLINYGYTYINIDDGWQGVRGGKYNAIMPNEKFPDMKGLVDYIHSLGLKAGIYSSPWVWTYAGYTGGSADQPDGTILSREKRHGAHSFEESDVKQFVEWGFDYLKYDWNPIDVEHTKRMSDVLRSSGRDIVFSVSNSASYVLAGEWARLTNLWRTTFDIHDSWYSLTSIGFSQNKWQSYAGPGHWNDPDMLVVGTLGWGNSLHKTKLSPNEQYLHISLWSILAAPLLIGCDMSLLDDFTLNLLSNREVIEVSQDPAGIQGWRTGADKQEQCEVWCRPLADGSLAVGLFNLSDRIKEVSFTWEDLNIKGDFRLRDLWTQTDIGIFSSEYSCKVPVHGVVLLKMTPPDK